MEIPDTNTPRRFWDLLTPADNVTILFLLITLLYMLVLPGRIDHPWFHIMIHTGIIAGILFMIKACSIHNIHWLKILRDLYPLVLLTFFFIETNALHYCSSCSIDNQLIKADLHLFGFLPSEKFSLSCPSVWFSELMYSGYFSFYLIILFFTIAYYIKLPGLFQSRFYIFLQSFYLFYLIFIVVPSKGPQFFIPVNPEMHPEGIIGRFVHMIIHVGDRPTGAFPSSHVGIAWLILFLFLKDRRRWFFIWVIPVIILTLSTVYIRAHYAVDVIGGFLMAVILYFTGFLSIKYFKNNPFFIPETQP